VSELASKPPENPLVSSRRVLIPCKIAESGRTIPNVADNTVERDRNPNESAQRDIKQKKILEPYAVCLVLVKEIREWRRQSR
jgi:hypothetical protein